LYNSSYSLLTLDAQSKMMFEQSSSSLGLHVKTFDHSRSSLGLYRNDVCSHQFRPRSSSNDF
ncbi:hypothetical protein Tco_0483028, partial [Tanacetum coccineum]